MTKIATFDPGNIAKDVRFMNKVNTTLLSICTAGILWMAKEVNSLDSRVSALETRISEQSNTYNYRLQSVEKTQNDHSIRLYDMSGRIDVLESQYKFKK